MKYCRLHCPPGLQFDIPATYPATAPEIEIPELDGKTAKMYRGGKICLTIHFKPLWGRNRWGLTGWEEGFWFLLVVVTHRCCRRPPFRVVRPRCGLPAASSVLRKGCWALPDGRAVCRKGARPRQLRRVSSRGNIACR